MSIVVTGSIAYDYLMFFPGKFTDHILPEHLHRVSLSFLVESMDKRRGGCAPNIAYTLALLGERPILMAPVGEDFGEYRQWLEAAGVDTSHVKQVAGKFTASFFCNTDQSNNQIATFYAGAMADAGALSFRAVPGCTYAIIAPNDPNAMVQYADECRTLGISFIFDPGQQCTSMSGDQLREGAHGAAVVICNDYEFEILKQKTGLSLEDLLAGSRLVVVTRGEKGSSIYTAAEHVDVPAVTPHRIVDPTGVGDAYRGGFLKGLAQKLPPAVCGRLGSVAAAYALEHLGGQSHAYTWTEFAARYAESFGPLEVGART
jgi:adenosine kinase